MLKVIKIEECYTCLSNQGIKRVSPGPTIYEGNHWLVEHAYPCQMKGWLVIATKKHFTTLHELTTEQFEEFAKILEKTSKVLYSTLKCEREYNMFFGEAQNFNHLHYHLIAIPPEFPKEYRGANVFKMLKEPEKALPPNEIKEFCEYLKTKF